MIIIAIDGPAGSGKSTVACNLAKRLGIPYLDTGAMYRGMTLGLVSRGVNLNDPHAVAEAVQKIVIVTEPGSIIVDGRDATQAIRSSEITKTVSAVAAIPEVRVMLVTMQRKWIADHGGGVVEGRDIGTVVFPDATLKLYLTARPEVRARRRAGEIPGANVDAIAADITRRDIADSVREASPLSVADDAITVDGSDLTVDEIIDTIVSMLP